VKLEKSLAELESKRLDVIRVEREKKNAKRYRGIRFIEGQKLTRKLKQLRKSLATAEGEDRESVDTEIQKVSRDLLYIKHYPNSEKYISILLPATEENAAHIARIRRSIEEKLKEAAIVGEADEGAAIAATWDGVAKEEDDMAEEDDFFLGEGEEDPAPAAPESLPVPSFDLGDLEEDRQGSGEGAGLAHDNGDARKRKEPRRRDFKSPGGRQGGSKKFELRRHGDFRAEGEAGAGHGGEDRRKEPTRRRDVLRKPSGHKEDSRKPDPGPDKPKQPTRTRAEGGRKRRRKKN